MWRIDGTAGKRDGYLRIRVWSKSKLVLDSGCAVYDRVALGHHSKPGSLFFWSSLG